MLSSALPAPRGSDPCRGNTKPRPRPKRFHFSGDEQKSPQAPRSRAAVYTQTRTRRAPRRAPGESWARSPALGSRKRDSSPAAPVLASPPLPPGDSTVSKALWIFWGERLLDNREEKEILTQQQTCWDLQNGKRRAFHGRALLEVTEEALNLCIS